MQTFFFNPVTEATTRAGTTRLATTQAATTQVATTEPPNDEPNLDFTTCPAENQTFLL